MPKRKFSTLLDRSHPPNSNFPINPPRHHDRITPILTQHTTLLHRALKTARGFERQKLGRRQKTVAGEKNLDDIRRLKLEVAELKALDLAHTSKVHLYKSLCKVKAVANSGNLPGYVRATIEKGREGETVERMNVQARLFKAEGVRKAVREAVEGVRAALGVGRDETKGKGEKRLRTDDYGEGRTDREGGEKAPGQDVVSPSYQEEEEEEEEEEWEGLSSSVRSETDLRFEVEDDEFESVDGDNYEHYATRLAASSDSESGSHSGFEGLRLDSPESNQLPSKRDSTLSLSPPLLAHVTQLRQRSKLPNPTPTTSSTTFLPTLLTSGYYSGDSDASSPSDQEIGRSAPPPRKNRMGQQARRALWEKKFKDKANHLRNGGQATGSNRVDRDGGWDARKGAIGGDEDRGRGGRRDRGKGMGRGVSGRGRRESRGATGANTDPVGVARSRALHAKEANPRENADAPLHPSWEAAKRAKETKMSAVPTGKKVVF